MRFPKTVKGYIGRIKQLDDSIEDLKGFNKLDEKRKNNK